MNAIDLAKKKVLVLAATLCMFSFLLLLASPAATHHGPWLVVPFCFLMGFATVFLLKASVDLQKLKRAGKR